MYEKVTDFEFIRFYNRIVNIVLFSTNGDTFPANARIFFMDSRSKKTFSSPWYLMVCKGSFLRGVKGPLLKSMKNGLSLE